MTLKCLVNTISTDVIRSFAVTLACTAATVATAGTANATVWNPTNEDTDFIQLDFGGTPGAGLGITTNGGILALFDDNTGLAGPALEIGMDGGHVVFTPKNDGSGDWVADL